LGFGTIYASFSFLSVIMLTVIYMTLEASHRDEDTSSQTI